ncbi:hypothetical protein F4703DRAFT_1894920, partial [Phycomyces blakesleeanus]
MLLLLFNTLAHTRSYSRTIYIYEPLSYFGYTILYILLLLFNYTDTHQKLLPKYIYIRASIIFWIHYHIYLFSFYSIYGYTPEATPELYIY